MLKSKVLGSAMKHIGNRHVFIEGNGGDVRNTKGLLCHAGPIMLMKGKSSHMMNTGSSQIHSDAYRSTMLCDEKHIDLYMDAHAYDKFGWAKVNIVFFKASGRVIALPADSQFDHHDANPLVVEFDTLDYHYRYEFQADGTWTGGIKQS